MMLLRLRRRWIVLLRLSLRSALKRVAKLIRGSGPAHPSAAPSAPSAPSEPYSYGLVVKSRVYSNLYVSRRVT